MMYLCKMDANLGGGKSRPHLLYVNVLSVFSCFYLLGGSPKVGKSWLALQLSLAVCGGKPFLGRRTRQTEVLYLALEDGPQRLHARALRLTDTAPQGLYFSHTVPPIAHGLEQQLAAFLAANPQVRLVIIDTLQKVRCAAATGQSYGGDYQEGAALQKLAQDGNICLLAIHHLRKMPDEEPMNRLPGTNGLTGAADGTLVLIRPDRALGGATLIATGRDIEDMEEELEFSNCSWSRVMPLDKLHWPTGKRGAVIRTGGPLQIHSSA